MVIMYYENPSGVSVHTGFPNPATDASLQGIDLNKLLIQNGASTFLMRVSGNDWQAVGIWDGDLAIIDRALGPKKTDLIIWIHRDEFAISAHPAWQAGGE